MDRDCIPVVPKPRKRRPDGPGGLEHEGVTLAEFAGPSTAPRPPPRFDPLPPRPTEDIAERGSLLARQDISHTGSKSFVSLFARGLGNVSACEDLLLGIDHSYIATSFTIFRQVQSYFPFVELDPGADVIAMVSRRPVLTLAICTVAAASHPEMQNRLSKAFQYALSSKIILESEHSLDLLTGLLVYIAWHHQYLSQDQVYHELYMLAATAAVLGLYQPRLDSLDQRSTLERDRAFVGCYYLCSSLSAVAFDKPNPLRWTDRLRTCAENAAALGSLIDEQSLIPHLELAHALDEMEDALRPASLAQDSNLIHLVNLQTKATSQRLKALKREHPSLGGSLAFAAASIHVYRRMLRSSDDLDHAVLIQCACAIKAFLEDVLDRPPATLHQVSIVDWTNLLEILLLMSRVAKPSHSAGGGWEIGAITSMLQPEVVLELLYSHMASVPSNDLLSPRHEPLIQWFRNICDGIKKGMLQDGASGLGASETPLAERHFRPINEHGRRVSEPFNHSSNGVLDMDFWNRLAAAR